MPIDPNAVGATTEPKLFEWTDRETLLYALGVGAGIDDLSFTTENSHDIEQQVLPTYAVICCPAFGAAGKVGTSTSPCCCTAGSRSGCMRRCRRRASCRWSPRSSTSRTRARARTPSWCSRAAAPIPTPGHCRRDAVHRRSSAVRAASAEQPGERPVAPEIPDREPDAGSRLPTTVDQPLIYRLSGDRNPLHSDPWFAQNLAGFPKPILHGLCTYGFAGRVLVAELGGGDANRVTRHRRAVHVPGVSRRDADDVDLAHRTRPCGIPHRGFCGPDGSMRGWCSRTARRNTKPKCGCAGKLICRSRFTGPSTWQSSDMAFKLTYSDGHETDYDDETKWEVENGVVKMGSEDGSGRCSSRRVTGQPSS